AELKRRDIRPNAKMVSPRAGAQQQTELARLYADYESLLATQGLVDHEGTLGAARNALAENACRRFDNLELIVVDGFTDFTRTEHDILHLLSQRAQHLLISLPSDTTTNALRTGRFSDQSEGPQHLSTRQDLFAKTTATLNE